MVRKIVALQDIFIDIIHVDSFCVDTITNHLNSDTYAPNRHNSLLKMSAELLKLHAEQKALEENYISYLSGTVHERETTSRATMSGSYVFKSPKNNMTHARNIL